MDTTDALTMRYYQLTSLQSDILAEQLIYGDKPVYIIGGTTRIEGGADYESCRKAINHLLQRHDALRIRLHRGAERIVQSFGEAFEYSLTYHDFSGEPDPELAVSLWIKNRVALGFNLFDNFLFEFALLKAGDETHFLFQKYHHLIIDGWGASILADDFVKTYTVLLNNRGPQPGAVYSYTDFIAENRSPSKPGQYQKDCEYWREKFKTPVEPLPVKDNCREPGDPTKSSRQTLTIESETYGRIRQLSQKYGFTTPNYVLAILFSYFCHLYSLPELVIGVAFNNRRNPQFKNTVGLFANVIPLRFKMRIGQTLLDLPTEIQRELRKAYRHTHLSLSEIAGLSGGGEPPGRRKLFDICFSYEVYDNVIAFASDHEVNLLTVHMREYGDGGLKIDFDYQWRLFDGIFTAGQMIRQLEHMIGNLLANPKIAVTDIEIVLPDERARLIREFNDTGAPDGKSLRRAAIAGFFEEQVRKDPRKAALVDGDQVLSYGELNQKANQLSRKLREKGVGPGKVAGVMAERSSRLILGILGVIKAGGVCLPIDPAYPPERIRHMLTESAAAILLTLEPYKETVEFSGAVMLLDDERIYSGNAENPEGVRRTDDLAYIMYTSGSTGRPKGILIPQSGVVRLVINPNFIQFNEHTRILQTAAVVFDASLLEIWGALLNGGTLYIAGNEALLNPARLEATLRTYRINTMWLTSALFNQLVDLHSPAMFAPLQYLLVGGEVLSVKHINRVRAALPDLTLINGYGPTENTTFSTCYAITKTFETGIPIGRSIRNSTCYIINRYRRLMPVGVTGELCVGGDGVARGYLNQPELTAQKFIADPFAPGKKLYLTGDLARWLPDGNLEFWGRMDSQVKIRGYRVEPGELENVVKTHPDVTGVVAAVKTDQANRKQLAVYFTARTRLPVGKLRAFVRGQLPDYMLPSFLIQLERFPLTENGKIDRNRLPEPELTPPPHPEDDAPAGEVEQRLFRIWREVLHTGNIGYEESFFERGGDSLSAIQLMLRINCEFQTDFTIDAIFEAPSIRKFALKIHGQSRPEISPIEVIPEAEYYPLSAGQRRLWILSRFGGPAHVYNIPFCFLCEGDLNRDALDKSCQYLIQRHQSLRTVFVTRDGEPYQKVLADPGFSIKRIDLSGEAAPEESLRRFARAECEESFDLENGPLIRITLISYDPSKTVLILNMHHIVSDGWSVGIFHRELTGAYEAFCKGRTPRFQPLAIQYKDYAAWQNQRLTGAGIATQKSYWLDKLAGGVAALDLPLDFPRPPVQTYNGKLARFPVETGIYQGLKKIAAECSGTLFMVLTALVKIILHRYTGQEEIATGTPAAGRNHLQLEDQIGFYVNTLLLRDTVRGRQSFPEYLETVKQTVIAAFSNQDYPFDMLVNELNLPRDQSRPPLFDVMTVLHQGRLQQLELAGIHTAPFEIESITTSKFALTFHYQEYDGQLTLLIEYNTDLFRPSRIERMAGHLNMLAQSVISNQRQAIAALNILSPREKKLLLEYAENLNASYPENLTLVDLFERQVQKGPDRVAAVYDDQELTYIELNRLANRIAYQLRSKGVRRGDIVALLMGRSIEMVASILGVIKSGGAYLPINLDFPAGRIEYILGDSNAQCLIIGRESPEPLKFTQPVIRLGEKTPLETPDRNPEPVNTPDDPAYVIYTSGTTGKPKGVMIRHRNVVRLLFNSKFPYDFSQNDVWTMFHSYCFDVSVWEMYGSLLYGAKLIVVPARTTLDPQEYLALLARHRVTVLNQTPSVFYAIAKQELQSGVRDLTSLRYIIFAGEKLDPAKLAGWRGKYPDVKLVNMYGITEVTVHTTFKEIGDPEIVNNISNIGRAIPTSSTYICDPDFNLTPVGVFGEIWVGGLGVAPGYLNLEKLTADRFIANPYQDHDTIYRSGDYARFLENGEIEYGMRLDHQVQIRGFRVELGDIEANLRRIGGITDAVALDNTDEAGGIYLTAYLITQRSFSLSELKRSIAGLVPHYMVPDRFVKIDTIPLTPNGKTDRRALLNNTDYYESDAGHETPTTEIEIRLAAIWKQLLGGEHFGVNDNFFEAGGNSLLLIRLHSEIQRLYPVKFRVVDLFSYPTIKKLAEYILENIGADSAGRGGREEGERGKAKSGARTDRISDIAVIGIGVKLNNCNTVEEFWECLAENRDLIGDLPPQRAADALNFVKTLGSGDVRGGITGGSIKFKQGNYLEAIDTFDYSFFNLSPREASLTDPAQRLFLETAWQCIEDAGYGGDQLTGTRTGVFVGYNSGKIQYEMLFRDQADGETANLSFPGNTAAIIPSRISYVLDLKGPALCIDTACSASLAALHYACQSLRNNECDLALTGGVKIHLCPLDRGIRSGIESGDGRARPFDNGAEGTGLGEGVIVFLLKPLEAAAREHDHIYAVIKGSAVNQDGRTIGITVPSAAAQQELIIKAWEAAGIDPETISFIEAHGTGTKLGDPIEVSGITRAFRNFTPRKRFCALSSVKANLGHLDTAAGAAGLLKSILVINKKVLPPLLHFEVPNREIDFETAPVYVNQSAIRFDPVGQPLRCGVSSFGLSGTNCHAVLEEYSSPSQAGPPSRPGAHLFTLSGKTGRALSTQAENFRGFLKNNPGAGLADICYTVNLGRGHYNYRLAVIVSDPAELAERLTAFLEDGPNAPGIFYGFHKVVPWTKEKRGSHEITETEIQARTARAGHCLRMLQSGTNPEILTELVGLYISAATVDWRGFHQVYPGRRISLPTYSFEKQRCWFTPDLASPASVSLASESFIGRCLVKSRECDIYGAAFFPDLHWVLGEHTINGRPVLAGTGYLELCLDIAARYYPVRGFKITALTLISPLSVNYGACKEAQITVAKDPGMLRLKVISNDVSRPGPGGEWEVHAQAEIVPAPEERRESQNIDLLKQDAKYLDRDGLDQLAAAQPEALAVSRRWDTIQEAYLGEDFSLTRLRVRPEFADESGRFRAYPPLIDSAVSTMLALETGLYLPVVFQEIRFYDTVPPEVYSYIRKESSGSTDRISCSATIFKPNGEVVAELRGIVFKKATLAKEVLLPPVGDADDPCFYQTRWFKSPAGFPQAVPVSQRIAIFYDDEPSALQIITVLQKSNHCVLVSAGDRYQRLDESHYTVGKAEADYLSLFAQLKPERIERVVHLSALAEGGEDGERRFIEERKERGVYSALLLVKGLLQNDFSQMALVFVSRNAYKVTGTEAAYNPENAALFGLAQAIPREYPGLRCVCIDMDLQTGVEEVAGWIGLPDESPREIALVVALRENIPYLREIQPAGLERNRPLEITIKPGCNYLITGGTGGIGLEIAKYLAEKNRIRLILLNRSEFPKRADRERLIRENRNPGLVRKIKRIREIEQTGSEVCLLTVDVADYQALDRVIRQIRTQYGRIAGVIHSAGIAGQGFLISRQLDELKNVVAPKIDGTRFLDELTRPDHPDFFVMCSAVSVFFGTPGQGDYNAANSFLDTYAVYRNRSVANSVSVNWPAWREVGMAVEYGADFQSVFYGLTNREAIIALDRIFRADVDNIIPGRLNRPFIAALETGLPVGIAAPPRSSPKPLLPEPVPKANLRPGAVTILGRADSHYSPAERLLARIWAGNLGYTEIDIYRDFYQLGGDSLNAAGIINEINREFQTSENIVAIFNHPSIESLARYLEKKRGTSRENPENNGAPAISSRAEPGTYPLSPGQRRIYVLHRLDPQSIAYNLPVFYTVKGRVDPMGLERAIQTVIGRQESLRTSFQLKNHLPVPQVHRQVEFSLAVASAAPDQVGALINDFIRPFDLTAAPLMRARLLVISGEESILLLDMHHIIADAWSIEIFMNEIAQVYHQQPLPPLELQYRDFAIRQNERWDAAEMKPQKEYWLRRFSGNIPLLELPLDYPRPEVRSFEGDVAVAVIDAELLEKLRDFARTHKTTLYTVILASFFILLHKYSGQRDLVVGSMTQQRPRREYERLIGFFINTLPIRTFPEPDKICLDYLNEVKTAVMEAFANQDYPFDELVEQLNLKRNLQRNPLTDVNFSFMSFDRHSGWPDDSTGLRRRMFPYTGARKTASKCDLTLFCTEGDNSLTLAFEYCSGIFTKQRMERMGRHLTEVVKSIAAGPQMKIAALEWISEAEKRQLLDDFNDTARQYRPDDHFCRLFAGTVGANPDSSALVFHGQTMSYAELDQYSNRLAKLIVNHGTGPGDVVGIVMNRSMGMIAAIIAVLKTGAAYLPVDPIYPDDRIGYMLENSGARLVITNTAPERRTRFSQTVIDIRGPVLSGPADIPPPRSRPDDLMYVIYTSGTTGTPKGIAVEQQNFLNYLNYMKEVFNFSAARTILCATSVSFDIFSFETLIPLTSGMRVVILDEPEQKDPARILDVILKEAVNMVQLTPSHLGMLTQVDPELKCFQNVDTLLLAGESIPPGLFRRVRQYYPHKFCNGYGPTEATVYTSIKDLSGESRVTIGKPVANSRVYIWDENQKLLPVGVPGELVISGRCVARGYINNHALNQRYFVQDPFDPAQKCYKSGDIALWLENGDLAVLGRQDRQVKIRGNRVEPAEIEAVLLEAGGVKDVTVVNRRDHPEQVHLCAYLVPAAGYDLAALKRFLKAKLPDYMIPAYFITLDQIPLNVNGKVDRGQLPPPGRINIGLDREFIPPAELLEYEIAAVWRRVLAIDRAGVEDNFFELGGSSFNIIRVNSELNQLLDREIELLELFRYPTIRSLARHLKNEPEISGDSPDGEESGGGLSGGRDKLRRRRHRIKERSDVNE